MTWKIVAGVWCVLVFLMLVDMAIRWYFSED